MPWPDRSWKIAGARAAVVVLALAPALLARADFSLSTLLSPTFYLSVYDDISSWVGNVLPARRDEGRLALAWSRGGDTGGSAFEPGSLPIRDFAGTAFQPGGAADAATAFEPASGSRLLAAATSFGGAGGAGGGAGTDGGTADFAPGFRPDVPSGIGGTPPGSFVFDPPSGTVPGLDPSPAFDHPDGFPRVQPITRPLAVPGVGGPFVLDPGVTGPGGDPLVPHLNDLSGPFLDTFVPAGAGGLGDPAFPVVAPRTVPEPGTLLLLAGAVLLVPIALRRRRSGLRRR